MKPFQAEIDTGRKNENGVGSYRNLAVPPAGYRCLRNVARIITDTRAYVGETVVLCFLPRADTTDDLIESKRN